MSTRLERVIVDLDDRFSNKMAGMAASTALFRRELDKSNSDVDVFNRNTDRSSKSIDRFSGRLGLMANVAAALGPALIPIGAVAIPAVAGLAAQFGFAAVAGGVAVAAFQGVGGALEALNKANLEPTAENLEAAHEAMMKISPAAREFTRQLRDMGPALKGLRDTAAEGMFPGLTEGLDSLEGALPKVERIVAAVSGELGTIGADAGASLASKRWEDFFEFLATDAPSALSDLSSAIGDTSHALAEMWMAFDPVNDDFSTWMVKVSRDFDQWATGLDQTAGFQEFLAYLSDTGPQVADTLGAMGSALLQIVEAAAPIGGPVLQGIEAFAKAVSAIADSDLGTPIFGTIAVLSALNLAMRTSAALNKATFGGPVVTSMKAGMKAQGASLKGLSADWAAYSAVQRTAAGRAQSTGAQMIASRAAAERLGTSLKGTALAAGKAGAVVGGLAVLTTGLGDKMNITNTASLGLMGTMMGPWGVALGLAVGGVIDLSHANDELNDSLAQLSAMAGKVSFDAFNDQLKDTEKRLDKLKDPSFWDSFKDPLGTLFNPNSNPNDSKIDDGRAQQHSAELTQQMAGRNAGSAAASRQSAAAAAAAGFRLTGAAAREAGMSVSQLTASLNAASAALNRQGTFDAARASLLDMRDALKENGTTLDRNTRAGLANRASMRAVAGGFLTAGAEIKNFAARTKYLDGARDSFIKVAHAAGIPIPVAKRLATQLKLIDRTYKPKVEEQGAAASAARVKKLNAEIRGLKGKIVDAKEKGASESSPRVRALRAAIAALKGKIVDIKADPSKAFSGASAAQRAIDSVHGKSVEITVTRKQVGVGATGARGMLWADGVRHYAYGDVADRHMPEIAPGSDVWRVWGEKETKGESYIPHADDDRRPRARAILEETIGRLGGDPDSVEWYARGGGRGGRGGSKGPNPQMVALTKALAVLTRSVDKQTAARDAIAAKRVELAGGVRDKFRSDIFGESNAWAPGGGGMAGSLGIMKADIAKANRFKAILGALSRRGLDGDAMAEIASTGDVSKAQALLSTGKAGIGQFETLVNRRAAASSAVGAYAGTAAFGAMQAAANAQLVILNASVKRLELAQKQLTTEMKTHPDRNGKATGKAINGAAAGGQRAKGRH